MNELEKVLVLARSRVSQGWVQNAAQVDGKVCAGAAMVLGWRQVRRLNLELSDFEADALYLRMAEVFMAAIRELWPDLSFLDIPKWNDTPGRTLTEVLDTFERALKIAERDG
jgi:hypothetical protein